MLGFRYSLILYSPFLRAVSNRVFPNIRLASYAYFAQGKTAKRLFNMAPTRYVFQSSR